MSETRPPALVVNLVSQELTAPQVSNLLNDFDIYMAVEALNEELDQYGCKVHVIMTITTQEDYLEPPQHHHDA